MNLNIRFVILIIALQTIVTLLILWDVPVIRQILGFSYLLFIPGFVLLRTLRIKNLELSETLIFSIGLSIALLMFIGLLVNGLLPLVGLPPLHPFLLLLAINSIIFPPTLIASLNEESSAKFGDSKSIFCSFLLFLLPMLSVLGSFFAINHQNNILLLFVIILILAYLILAAFKKGFSLKYYPLILFVGAFSLLFMSLFTTNFILLWDQTEEYYTFRITQVNQQWNPDSLPSVGLHLWKTNSMVSVTILPTMFFEISRLDGFLVFKVLFPFLVSLVPVVLYQLYRTQTSKVASLIAAALFISNSVGLGWGNDMQMVAQLFYALSLLVIFKENLSCSKKGLLFIFFTFALVISHYSMAYILAFTMLLVWVISKFIGNNTFKIPTNYVLIAVILTFSWNIFISNGAAFDALIESGRIVLNNLHTNFFNIEARGREVAQFLGASQVANTVLHEISRSIFRLSTILIVFGFISVILKKNGTKFDKEFLIIVYLNMLILILNMILPGLSLTYLMQRFYQTTLIVLSPLFVIGGTFVFDILSRKSKPVSDVKIQRLAHYFTVLVLISLFLFQSGFIYEVTKVKSWSVPLSKHRIDRIVLYDELGYTNVYDVFGAEWLSPYVNTEETMIYSDAHAIGGPLLSYGLISNRFMAQLFNSTRDFPIGSFIYLRWVNTIEGRVTVSYIWNISDVHQTLDAQNLVYSNGGCLIYKTQGDSSP